jgi:flagellar motor switch protein FliN/FliY
MVIGNLIDSTMVQLYPVSFAHEMCKQFEDNEENEKLRREFAAKRAAEQ